MLTSIAEKLWGTSLFDEDDSPGKSTSAGDEEVSSIDQDAASVCSVNVSDFSCCLWEVDGNDAREVLSSASVQLTADKLVIGSAEGNREYRYSEMVHFHQLQEEIFQWIVKKSSDDVEEFGLVFPSGLQGGVFNREIRPKLRETAEVLCREPVLFREYDRETREWKEASSGGGEAAAAGGQGGGSVSLAILQRKKDFEGYLVVMDIEGKALSEVGVSHEEYIFPQPDDAQLSWWGPGSDASETQRQMYGAKFSVETEEEKASMNRVFEIFERVLQEHAAEKKIEGPISASHGVSGEKRSSGLYDDDSFELKTGRLEGGSAEEVVWMDAEEGEDAAPPLVVCRDSTRAIAAKCPSSKVHKLMYVGTNRTFVVRGSAAAAKLEGNTEMQVLKWENESSEVVATIDGQKLDYLGKKLCPTKALLLDGETKMLMLNEGEVDNVYMMDIEKETVVQSWSAGDAMSIQNLIPKSKDAASTIEPTFLCSNPKSIFVMDTRIGDNDKKKPSEGGGAAPNSRTSTLSYATNVQFTCGATDEKGHVLMGSKSGDLRLYDGEPNKEGKLKRAKTHLQGLGDPLQHVAVTKDGSWILGTCAKYLVLFPVKLSSSGKNGFVSALGKSKPPPIVLKLSMEDMLKYNLTDVNFVKAEFNADESAIVTSTGNLAIVWDFRRAVAEGGAAGVGAYTIRAVDDYIKDVDFMRMGAVESIVMATPCNVSTKPILSVAI